VGFVTVLVGHGRIVHLGLRRRIVHVGHRAAARVRPMGADAPMGVDRTRAEVGARTAGRL
jgi:hypothetical protein